LLRLDDVADFRVTAQRPVRLQVDGDDLGEHREGKVLVSAEGAASGGLTRGRALRS